MTIELFRWEYRPPIVNLPLARRVKRKPVPNFGDEVGPMIVRDVLERSGRSAHHATSDKTLFSVGSVMHFVKPGDHVWGTGFNAKRSLQLAQPETIKVHAVRGPKTAKVLEAYGVEVPRVYGDPALLISDLASIRAATQVEKTRKLVVIPNFNDLARHRNHPDVISPLQPPEAVARAIAQSELVVGSSLHAMVFADALGVPSRLITSTAEHPFKYEDYYLGTGRQPQTPAYSVEDAVRRGGGEIADFDAAGLRDAFPYDLFPRR